MRDIIVLITVLGAIPFILIRPQIGIYVWSWLAYMNPQRLTYGFAYSFPFSMIIGLVTIISVVFSKEPKRFPVTPVTVVLIILVLWMVFNTFFALSPNALAEMIRTLKIQLMTFIMLLMITNRQQLHTLVWVITASLGFFGVKGGIFVLLTGGAYRVWGPEGSFVEDNNALALALLMVVPLMYYLFTQTKNKWLKWFLVAAMILTMFSVIASYSRGAMLASLSIGLILWWKSKKKVLVGLIITVLAFTLLTFMPPQWMDRMNTLQDVEQDSSAMGRINAWWFAYNLAKDRVVIGGGFQTFRPELFEIYAPDPYDFHDAHSIYFEMLGEQGFLGLFLFLLLLFLAFRTGTWLIKNTKGKPELQWASILGAMLQVSIIGYCVGGAFLGLAYYDLPYNIIAMLVITQIIVKKELEISENKQQKEIIDQPPIPALSSRANRYD